MNDILSKTPFSKDYVDFPLNSNAIDSIEILTGPSMPESKKELLNALLKYYNVKSNQLHSSKFYVSEEKSK